MTLFVPLDPSGTIPATPHFLVHSQPPVLDSIVNSIVKAKRIVVVCGAGISVHAGIPDFRSSEGLFQSLKKDNASISSGKDLFDARVFQSEQTLSQFYKMIANLSQLSSQASPTPFHTLLKSLDAQGSLLRVYTQNIDRLEEKAGLSSGVPTYDPKVRSTPKKSSANHKTGNDSGLLTPPSSVSSSPSPVTPSPTSAASLSSSTSQSPHHALRTTPRCIPLHGTLSTLQCPQCSHTLPLAPSVPLLLQGSAPTCPQCTDLETTRQLVGKRLRGIGRLRPSVVLYGEDHREGEAIGEVVRKDLSGAGGRVGRGQLADLLIVVGTSLRVPGTKRIVKEFSKVVRKTGQSGGGNKSAATVSVGSEDPTPSSSSANPPPTGAGATEKPLRSIYLNLDFPVPVRDWEGVFDVWVQGDSQRFAEMVLAALAAKSEPVKAHSSSRSKRKAGDDAASPKKKRKLSGAMPVSTPKKAGIAKTPAGLASVLPPTPASLPRKRQRPTSVVPLTPAPKRLKPDSAYLTLPVTWRSATASSSASTSMALSVSSRDDPYGPYPAGPVPSSVSSSPLSSAPPSPRPIPEFDLPSTSTPPLVPLSNRIKRVKLIVRTPPPASPCSTCSLTSDEDAQSSISDTLSSRPRHVYQSKHKQSASASEEVVLDTGWTTSSRGLKYYDGQLDGGRVTLTDEELSLNPTSLLMNPGLLREALREKKRQCIVA